MKTSIKLLSVLFAFTSFVSCNKNEDETAAIEPTKQELLLGTWNLQNNSGSPLSDCDKLSKIGFLTTSNFSIEVHYEEDGTCITDGLVTTTYSLQANDDIVIDYQGEPLIWHLESISETTLKVTTMEQGNTQVLTLAKKS